MNLFHNEAPQHVLPYDGEAIYYGKILSRADVGNHLNFLLNDILWKNDEAVIFGKHIITKRKMAWYGDVAFAYTYSKVTREALLWTPQLLVLKDLVEKTSGNRYNSCLLNLYHDGDEGMAWHSDDEKTIKKNSAIASLTFGAERKFSFKHKVSKHTASVTLENGSLLVMQGSTQTNWLHQLPKTTKVAGLRINLTFRSMVVGKTADGFKS
jgi:alkylated DNA repair dioxygenase AlkB